MKKILQLSLLVIALIFACNLDVQAQSKKKKSGTDKYFDESGNFASHLWYGAGFVFPTFNSGTDFFGNRFSFFGFGISPMVGYKLTPDFSAGIRASLYYEFYNSEAFPSVNTLNYGMGGFLRYKVFNAIFLHGEYGFDNEVTDYTYDGVNDKLVPERKLINNGYLGVGYNDSNGVWGYEISLLYNLLYDDSAFYSPFDLRFGFTYNF
ncbi:MAG: hypothetical protein MI974_16615 [Chitinophagales bacterium]|nr:hypothetical protein [Chitinophagales bacterium]